MKRLALALAAALGLPLLLTACRFGGCTEDACFDRAVVLLRSEAWVPGLYRVEVNYEGRSFTCEMLVPWTEVSDAPFCDAADVSFGGDAFGQLQPPGNDLVIDIHESRPAAIQLRVFRDGTEIANQTVEPDYQRVTASCDLVCQQGEAILALD